jgi:hypothetical protein
MRNYFGWIFGLSSILAWPAAVKLVHLSLHEYFQTISLKRGLELTLADAVLPLESVLFAIACWAVLKKRKSARTLGIAANILFILNSLFVIARGRGLALDCVWTVLGVSALGLVAFAWPMRDDKTAGAQGPGAVEEVQPSS